MRHVRKRLTYANVMSSIAVFLLIGGGAAFAAIKLPKNSVGTKQLKKNAVISSKVKNGSLTGADINLGSLGTVPSATNASHATSADSAASASSAGNANSVDGQSATKIFAKLADGAGTTAVANIAGFSMTASCPDVFGNRVVIELTSPSGVPSVLTASLSEGVSVEGGETEYNSGINVSITLDNNSLGETSFSAATTNGTVISGNIGYDYPNTFSGEEICVIYGEALSG